MRALFARLLWFPIKIWGLFRRRPRAALVTILGVLVFCGIGGWRYSVYQWREAQLALKEERLADARGRLGYCLTVWPYSSSVHLLAARTARLSGDLETAETHLNRCLRLEGGPSQAVQLEFLLFRVQAGELDEVAEPLFATVETGHPEAPVILQTLARAYMHRMRYKLASSCLSRWIDLRPDEVKAYHWRGWVLERLGNHQGAAEDYRRALELDPDLIPVRLRLAEMLLEDKKTPEAVPHLERLYGQVPDNPQVRARLGTCRYLQGRTDEARRLLESAAEQLPRDPGVHVALANLDLEDGRGEEAERRLRALLELEPADTEALFVLVSALRLQGRNDEATAALKKYEQKREVVERTNTLLSTVVDSPKAGADDYAETGRLLIEIGRFKEGTYWLNRALERDPSNQQAHRALADYYERKGDPAEASAHRGRLRDPGRSARLTP